MMNKLPPIEKIYEAYSAIADNRVKRKENYVEVISSSRSKTYTVTWQDNTYTSSDSATYWQGYAGYPILAVLMLQGKLPLNFKTAERFQGINWTQLNAKYKADYTAATSEIFRERIPLSEAGSIREEVMQVYEIFKKLNLTIKRGKSHPSSSKRKGENAGRN